MFKCPISKPVALALCAAALALSGCLQAKEKDRAAYNAERDEFRLVMVLENITGSSSDLDYFGTLLANKDHLIAPVMPGGLFGYAPWFLRLSDHKAAKVSFAEPRKGDMNPIDVSSSLNAIDIRPGALYVQNNRLCYYHEVIIPGKTIDALIEQTRKDQLDPLKKSVKQEIDRRQKSGHVFSWEQLIEQEVKAIKTNSTDHPIKPLMVLEMASLDMIVASTADVKHGMARSGQKFQITVPLTPRDRDGAVQLWDTWAKAADTTATEKKDDPMLAMQRLPAKSMSLSTMPTGIVLSIDIVSMYNAFATAFATFADSRSPSTPAAEPTAEVQFATSHAWPLESGVNSDQILKDFDAGSLKAFPSPNPITPGTGLKVQPKK